MLDNADNSSSPQSKLRGSRLSQAIVELLKKEPEMAVAEISRRLSVSRQSVYEHLHRLGEDLEDVEEEREASRRELVIDYGAAVADIEKAITHVGAEIRSLNDLESGTKRSNAVCKGYDSMMRLYGVLIRLQNWDAR